MKQWAIDRDEETEIETVGDKQRERKRGTERIEWLLIDDQHHLISMDPRPGRVKKEFHSKNVQKIPGTRIGPLTDINWFTWCKSDFFRVYIRKIHRYMRTPAQQAENHCGQWIYTQTIGYDCFNLHKRKVKNEDNPNGRINGREGNKNEEK